MDYNTWCLNRYFDDEDKFERSCLHADCGHSVAPDERYVNFGNTYCMDCARDLAESCEEEGEFICEYCGEPIDTEYESKVFDGMHFHEECWDEYIREESECFGGYDEW